MTKTQSEINRAKETWLRKLAEQAERLMIKGVKTGNRYDEGYGSALSDLCSVLLGEETQDFFSYVGLDN